MSETIEQIVETKNYAKGDILAKKGEPIQHISIIISGTASASDGHIIIKNVPGSIIGLFGMSNGTYLMDYTATDDVVVKSVDYTNIEDIQHIFHEGKNYRQFTMNGSCREMEQLVTVYNMEQVLIKQSCLYVKKKYASYLNLCGQAGITPVQSHKLQNAEADLQNTVEEGELIQYFTEFASLSREVQQAYFEGGDTLAVRYLRDCISIAGGLLEGCEKQLRALEDKLELLCGGGLENLFSLYLRLIKIRQIPEEVRKELTETLQGLVNLHERIEQTVTNKLNLSIKETSQQYRESFEKTMKQLAEGGADENFHLEEPLDDVSGLLSKLLEYSELEAGFREDFRGYLQKYKDMKDRSSSDNEDRTTRKKLTDLFYELYQAVFFKAEKEECHNTCIRLLLDYGIVDETMFKPSVLESLANCQPGFDSALPVRVYTIRQWLHEIYIGEKEPSRNDFDQDYQEYLRELNKNNVGISEAELELQNAPEAKVKFEMENFFAMNNRLVSGRLLSFCPVLTGEDLNENIEDQIVTAHKVNQAFKKVLDVDFSVFYRDVMYDDRDNGITNLVIHQEILPDVVCLPNVGTLGRMWQEISGKKRATPGRFSLPVLLKDDIDKITLHMIGNFRWEICKRVQGNYWNDVSEPSLTSEFCDYLQFYKKNRDLSEKAKEKLGQLMTKSRGSYGEVFANQYTTWVTGESAGNVRLDKVARYILGCYCPFTKAIREKLIEQPMFTESINRYERERKKHLKELNNRRAGIRNCGGTETEEFLQEIEFYEM